MVRGWAFSLLDLLVLRDPYFLFFFGILTSKRQSEKDENSEESPLCNDFIVPSHSGSPSLKMATRKLVQWRDVAVLVAKETRIPEMRNSGRAHARAVGQRPGVTGPDREEVGRSWLGRVVAEAPPRPASSGDGVAGRGRWGWRDWDRRGRGSRDWKCQSGVDGLGAQGGRQVEAPATGKGDRSPPLPLATPLPGTVRSDCAQPRDATSHFVGSQSRSILLLHLLSHRKREDLTGLAESGTVLAEVPETQIQADFFCSPAWWVGPPLLTVHCFLPATFQLGLWSPTSTAHLRVLHFWRSAWLIDVTLHAFPHRSVKGAGKVTAFSLPATWKSGVYLLSLK